MTSARVSMPAQVVEFTDEEIDRSYYVWRTDLLQTKKYWNEWFEGLTDAFLEVKVKKQLILANIESLGVDLAKPYFQGQFKM